MNLPGKRTGDRWTCLKSCATTSRLITSATITAELRASVAAGISAAGFVDGAHGLEMTGSGENSVGRETGVGAAGVTGPPQRDL